ncbi:hydrolase 1, exosortase A system-associated [Sphingomonas psychrolutea]|nr:hydrolase 1, exosortase A system-associated [Sphingomonas psychrolutea]
MRRVMCFPCAGDTLFGTLDTPDNGAPGKTGLLIVSGGNEIRIGAHRGMALLAQRLAARGIPVFRFDRRGIGESTGSNGGFLSSGPDIGGAAATFSAEAGIERLVAFGNCDAATALALFGSTAGIDRLILANPWIVEPTDDLPPAAAIRSRYVEKLKDPRELWRLVSGGVNIAKLAKGLTRVSLPRTEPNELALRLTTALSGWQDRATILLAGGDATAIAYRDAITRTGLTLPTVTRDTPSHSFAREGDAGWLEERIVEALGHG